MKRLLLGLVAGLLVGCGSLSTPSTGQLLGAPTSLNLGGRSVTAQAAPTVSGDVFRVHLKVQSGGVTGATLPPLTVTDLYVVTREGVWRSAVGSRLRSCGQQCGLTTLSGPARGLQRGEGVQVVVGLRDLQGRPYLLRDGSVRVR